MVKKTYEAPSMNEARTKLRTGLLAGSTGFSGSNTQTIQKGEGDPQQTPEGEFQPARKRSVSSVD